MTELSSATKAVLKAASLRHWERDTPIPRILSWALYALAEECLHETPKGVHDANKGSRYMLAGEIRQIASELETAAIEGA